MRWIVASGLAIVLGAIALGAGARASGWATPAAKISSLRVCTSTAFSRKLARCTKDERANVIVSNRVTCSVNVDAARPTRLRQWMRYDGQLVPYSSTRVPRGRWSYWINQDYKINLPVPGGQFECGFSAAGKTLTAKFTSGGPVGDVVNTAACRGTNTLDYNGARVCRSDESAAPIPATTAVYCFAMFPKAAGKRARLAIVSGTQVLEQVSFTVGGVLWFGWIAAESGAGNLAPGSYACQYSLDGALVAEKPFTLLG